MPFAHSLVCVISHMLEKELLINFQKYKQITVKSVQNQKSLCNWEVSV